METNSRSTQSTERRYRAFISYRHESNVTEQRDWATWLQRSLERYPVPPGVVGAINQRGEKIPDTLFPIFRDEEALPAHPDVATAIHYGLENSDFMIVLCTPQSAASEWVEKEIREFKEMGKCDRILAVIIAGEPNASAPGKAAEGIAPDEECLPEALRYGVSIGASSNGDGGCSIDWQARAEPLFADFRPRRTRAQGFINSAAYRQHLIINSPYDEGKIADLVEDYAERIEQARFKIIAGIVGISPDVLRDRDSIYRAEQAEKEASRQREFADREIELRKQAEQAAGAARSAEQRAVDALRRLGHRTVILKLASGLLLIAAMVAGWKWWESTTQNNARRSALERGHSIARANGISFWHNGEWTHAIRSFIQALELDPANAATAHLLWHALACGGGDRLDLPDRVMSLPGEYSQVYFNPTLPLVMLSEPKEKLELWRHEPKWERIKVFTEVDNWPDPIIWSPDGLYMILDTFRGHFPLYRMDGHQPAFVTRLGERSMDERYLRFMAPHRLVHWVLARSLYEWNFEKQRMEVASPEIPEGTQWIALHPTRSVALITPKGTYNGFWHSLLFELDKQAPIDSLTNTAASQAMFSNDGSRLFVMSPELNPKLRAFEETQWGYRQIYDSRMPISDFAVSQNAQALLLALTGRRQFSEAIDGKDGSPMWRVPDSLKKKLHSIGFAPGTSEVMCRFGDILTPDYGPLMYYKLPSCQSAFAETAVDGFLQSFAWTNDRSNLLAQSNGAGLSFTWPSLKPRKKFPEDSGELPYIALSTYDVFVNYQEAIELPFLAQPQKKISVESGDGLFQLRLLHKNYTSSGFDSLAAVPVVKVRPPGDIGRFILPFLNWHEKPEALQGLIADRERLHEELLDNQRNRLLPEEWRDLLLWWTTKPGDRKPLYQK